MAAEIAAAAIAAAANLIGNFASGQINAERSASDMATYLNLVKKQRDWQKEDQAWSEQYAKNIMDYQFENFSSPSAQMSAYRRAGINPFLASQSGLVGSGQSVSPSAAPQPSRTGVTPFERSPIPNPFEGATDNIFKASQIKSQRIAALSEMAKSVPDLVKGIGKDSAKSVLGAIFGRDVDLDMVNGIVQNEAMQSEFDTKIKEVEKELAVKYGDKKASNFVALQEQQFNESAAKIGLMSSEAQVNEASIKKFMSEYIRNFADAYKLKREGDKYLIEADYYNALKDLTQQSFMRLKYQNLLSGFFPESFVHDALMSKDFQGKLAKKLEMWNTWQSDPTWTMVDRFFNDYLKVFGSSANSLGGASTTTTVTPLP